MAEGEVKFKSLEELKLIDIHAKLNIVKLVIKICLTKVYDVNINKNLLVKEASQYFSSDIITQLLAEVNSPITFNDWEELVKMGSVDEYDNYYNDKVLRDIILHFYLVKLSLPTKEAILINLVKNTNHSWRVPQLELCMRTRGYKSKRLPRSTRTIIVEDPKNSLARIKYLQNIEQVRKTGLPLIYIEEKIVTEKGCFFESLKCRNEDVTMVYMAASSSMGMINNKVIKIPSFSEPDNNDSLLTDWILETIVPYLSTPSVFVLEDKLHNPKIHEEMPTMYSSKTKMINWLEQNDIPYEPQMHSAELFELIKRSNRNLLRKNVLDEKLMCNGHKILLRPRKTQYLSYFNILWEKIFRKYSSLNMNLFDQMSINNWKKLETMLCDIEKKTLHEDLAVNKTLEKIFTYAEHEAVPFYFINPATICDKSFDEFKMEEIVKIDLIAI